MINLTDLTSSLGDDLRPEVPLPVTAVQITGVHVSELTDPTPYLAGGELLLSTGMSLTGHFAQARAYAARLVRAEVAAFGLGLGPIHAQVPASLRRACEIVGLPLLSVPAPTPFLTVSRAFWNQLASGEHEQLSSSLGAYHDLVRSAMRRDPMSQVVRTLGAAVHGWAARLDATGRVVEVWPRNRRDAARETARELRRVHASGPHSSATFPVGDEDVVVQPLARGERLVGHIAMGCPRPAAALDRQLQLAACSLLALQLHRDHEVVVQARTQRSCIAQLLVDGAVDAARALGDSLHQSRIPLHASLIRIRCTDIFGAVELLDRWEQGRLDDSQLWLADDRDEVWVVADAAIAEGLLDDVRTLRLAAVASPVMPVAAISRYAGWLLGEVRRAPDGQVVQDPGVSLGPAEAQLERLLAGHDDTLVKTVVSYLQHRGRWEDTARALQVHRNTVRHRINTVARVADVDLDDPDDASRLWVVLRARGLA
ncbi:Fis family transcriptional regulator [Flexivirga endophytica]|uniref:Fis family transcriptional regulator n=1 Tax=Flexivirga endophytica TaxID=1849103 RepID=A0A916SXH4_9MICO|nr:PucR family transcriptional regulator [Flexivirga endophytica]GGB21524.1 Fis family transcriptional regulator [Flexivirga endophytica]GHB59167.1 Fis family transcriptional regulator [Flexivirga endophytica]